MRRPDPLDLAMAELRMANPEAWDLAEAEKARRETVRLPRVVVAGAFGAWMAVLGMFVAACVRLWVWP